MDRFIDAFSYITVNKLITCLDCFIIITYLPQSLHFMGATAFSGQDKNVGSTNPLASGKNAEEQKTRSVQLKIRTQT